MDDDTELTIRLSVGHWRELLETVTSISPASRHIETAIESLSAADDCGCPLCRNYIISAVTTR